MCNAETVSLGMASACAARRPIHQQMNRWGHPPDGDSTQLAQPLAARYGICSYVTNKGGACPLKIGAGPNFLGLAPFISDV